MKSSLILTILAFFCLTLAIIYSFDITEDPNSTFYFPSLGIIAVILLCAADYNHRKQEGTLQ